jgi:hypothetical protein
MLCTNQADGVSSAKKGATMLTEEERRERITRMMGLAKVYRGWTSTQLADALGREPSRAVPATGNPQLDLLERLAEALDWETGDVADTLVRDDLAEDDEVADARTPVPRAGPTQRAPEIVRMDPRDLSHADFATLDAASQYAHRAGAYVEMRTIGLRMREIAANGRERATAANRLAGAYDGLGRYPRVLACVREGLAEGRIGDELRLMLTVNLAGVNYTLWNLQESYAIGRALREQFELSPAHGRIERVAEAFAASLAGHSLRRGLTRCESERACAEQAVRAEEQLVHAERLFAQLASDFDDLQYLGLANTARGGAIEARVASGRLSPQDAIEEIVERLGNAIDLARPATPHLVESWGWWGIFGANIAMRSGVDTGHASLHERDDLERAMAICTNKAAEIAEHLNHWPIRERAFTIEWFRRQQVFRAKSHEVAAWTLDTEDVRVLVGTMGRFPLFRTTGWAILKHAEFVELAA